MGYATRPPLAYFEVGSGCGDIMTVTTVSGDYNTSAGVKFPSYINPNKVLYCYMDSVFNYQNTDASGNTNHLEGGYVRLADTTESKYHTSISNIKWAGSSKAAGYYPQQRIYGNTEIEGSWFTAGRTYEVDLMGVTSTFNNINIYNWHNILRIILETF